MNSPNCPQEYPCSGCGKKVPGYICYMTCVGYYSPPGHDHDDNCCQMKFECPDCKLETTIAPRRKCPVEGCGWVGKQNCCGDKVEWWK